MSTAATARAWEASVSGVELLVLLALADFAGGEDDPYDYAYPAVSTLEKMTKLSRRTVQRCLRSLEEAGEIRTTGQHQWSAKKVTMQYRIEGRHCDAPSGEGASGEVAKGRHSYDAQPVLEPTLTSLTRPREVLDLEQLQASERRVLEILRFVASEKAADLNERRVLQILKDFPDRDHIAEAEKFEHWHLQGKGQNVQRRNLTTAWRNWLDSASPVEERPRMSSFNGWKRPSARSTLEQETAERLYPGVPDAVHVMRGALSRGRATDEEIRAWVRKWHPDIEDGAA